MYEELESPIEVVNSRNNYILSASSLYWLHSYAAMACLSHCHARSDEAAIVASQYDIVVNDAQPAFISSPSSIYCATTKLATSAHMNDTYCLCKSCGYTFKQDLDFLKQDHPENGRVSTL